MFDANSFEAYWNAIFGDRTAADVVRETGITAERIDSALWEAERIACFREGCERPRLWYVHHRRAACELQNELDVIECEGCYE